MSPSADKRTRDALDAMEDLQHVSPVAITVTDHGLADRRWIYRGGRLT
jgi:hypothetical protein